MAEHMGNDIGHDSPFEVIAGRADGAVFLTCEHGSERVPAPWHLPEPDVWLLGTHWAYDLGAADATRELARALDAPAVIAQFSRLLVDPNRPEDSDTLCRAQADGVAIQLNQGIDPAEREHRLEALYRPYHAAVDRHLSATTCPIVFAVHTFTPVYEGTARAMELGVLFDEEEALGEAMAKALHSAGFAVALNEPYSGRAGLIYAADRHAREHGRRPLEIEIRQDVATSQNERGQVVAALAAFFRGL